MAAPAFGTAGTHIASSSASASFAVPASVAADDIIIIPIFIDGSTVTISAMASGFGHATGSPITNTSGAGHTLAVVWKRATGADTGTYDFTLSGSTYRAGKALRYTGAITSGDPFDATNTAQETGIGTNVTPAVSVTTTGADRLLVWAATNWSGGGFTPPTDFTERMDDGDRVHTAADKAQAAAGSSGSITGTAAANDRMNAWLGALKPAGAATSLAIPRHPSRGLILR